jgi:DNA replication protein DnaC
MSDLLNRASKEAREGNLDIKRQVRHIGNHFLNSVEVGAQEAAYLVLQMPLTKASRDVVFINTSPSDDRVVLIKTDTELDKLSPNFTDMECSNVVKRYSKRPKQLENWCLADYVSQLDVVFPKENKICNTQKEINDDDYNESDCDSDESDVDFNESSTLVTLKNGIKIRRRKTPKVIRYVRFNVNTDAENHYREKLMLFLPWRDEGVDLLSGADTFETSFNMRKSFIKHKIKEYEHNAEQLDAALQMANEDVSDAYDELAPSVQQTEADDEIEGSLESESYVQFNPERPIEQREYDIGAEMGIQSTRQITEESSVRLSERQYLELLDSLNLKQREFFNHVLHWIKTEKEPIYAFLSGGAGVGKSVLIRALYQSLHRYLCSTEGENPDDIRILLCAYTGKAAYNIGGSTIASAFHQKINQNQQGMHCDELNTFRTKYRNLAVIIIDEISMVGNRSLALIDSRLQLLTGIKKPFGGISIIAVGDFFQLKPVMDRWIFQDLNRDAQSLANNLWKDHFYIFELHEIMRQKDDLEFAQLLNRLRHNAMTANDLTVIQRCMISETSDNYPHHAPHLFTQNSKVDAYNNQLIEKLDGEKIAVNSVDAVVKEYSKEVKQKLIRSLESVDDVSKTANLMHNLILAVGMIYDISVNVDVSDGLTNGSSCKVQFIERKLEGISRPSIVWVKFFDSTVGKITRKKYKHLFHEGISDDWTPVFEVQRSFVINHNTFQKIQFPLRPSAGKTVHKAQGCTVDEIVIDLSQNKTRKTPHIHYVALSRVRSVNHLHILNFNEQALATDEQVVEEMERLRNDAPLQLCYVPIYQIDSQHFKIVFSNCRSLHKHFPQIRNEPNILALDVIGFSETRLNSSDVVENYQLQGYTAIFNHEELDDLNRRPYHGTAMYVKMNTKQPVSQSLTMASWSSLRQLYT